MLDGIELCTRLAAAAGAHAIGTGQPGLPEMTWLPLADSTNAANVVARDEAIDALVNAERVAGINPCFLQARGGTTDHNLTTSTKK